VPFTDQFWSLISGGITPPKEEKIYNVRFRLEPERTIEKANPPSEKKRKIPRDKKIKGPSSPEKP
jgi:hypothetical protein